MSRSNNALSLADYQKLIKDLVNQRGFSDETIAQKFMLLLEEAGEFAKAARRRSGIKIDQQSIKFELDLEAADVFWMLLDLCNSLDIDLAEAFAEKERKNRSRSWS
jgi:NTP pyrophosphatase (non-canonical NTP hydrolase)